MREIDPAEIVASLRESLLVLTEDLVVEYASDRFFRTFDVDRNETIGVRLDALGNGQWAIPSLIRQLDRIVKEANIVEDFDIDHVFERIGRRVMRLNARKTVRPGNGSKRILVAIADVTAEIDAAKEAERQRLLSVGVVETVREPLLVLDEQLEILSANSAFYTAFRVDDRQTIGLPLNKIGNGQWNIPRLLHLLVTVVPKDNVVEDFEVRHIFPEIGERCMRLNARKIYREGNATHMLLLAIQDITERLQLEAQREAALEEARRLHNELNHRVMNSLSIVSSIIAMEGRRFTEEEVKATFARLRARIDAVGNLYKTLLDAGSSDSVDARSYLTRIIDNLVRSTRRTEEISLNVDIGTLPLSSRDAVPLGLIVNELITNSMKYAYQGRNEGKLSVSLRSRDETLELMIADDGPGIDTNARVDSGLGQKLTSAFSAQLSGTLTMESDHEGTRHVLVFPWSAAEDERKRLLSTPTGILEPARAGL